MVGQVVGLPDRERHDGQRRVLGPAGRELAAVRDEQIGDIVGLAELVADAVLCLFALAAGAHVVSAGKWRQLGLSLEHLVRVSPSRPLKISRSDKVNDGEQADNHQAEQ